MKTDKQLLKEQQPVAWKTLSGALRSKKLSHAYLFYGPKGPAKRQMGLLLAQSMTCPYPDEDGFACQECESCRRVELEESPDFFWLHPGGLRARKPLSKAELAKWWKEKSVEQKNEKAYKVRKEDILNLQEAFLTTSASGLQQAYLIEQYDTATPAASNSLLKFLEEPKEGLTGILLCDELSNVLPTIASRCQLIPFRPVSQKALEEEFAQEIDDAQIVSILAHAGYEPEALGELAKEDALFDLRDAAMEYWKDRGSLQSVQKLHAAIGGKNKISRAGAKYFLDCLLWLLKQEPISEKALAQRQILLEHLDAARLPLDPMLLIDRCAFEIFRAVRSK